MPWWNIEINFHINNRWRLQSSMFSVFAHIKHHLCLTINSEVYNFTPTAVTSSTCTLYIPFFFSFFYLLCLRTIGEQIAEGTFVIGSLERVWDNSSLLTVKEREAVGAVSKIWIFRRAKLYGAEFQSSFYMRSTARNNFTIVYERNGKLHYGSIEKFAKYQAKCTTMSCQYKECSCELSFHYVALIKKMRKHPCQLPLYEGIKVINHITRVTVADNPIAIPMSSLKKKCMRIELDAAHVYVCHLPNSFEKD